MNDLFKRLVVLCVFMLCFYLHFFLNCLPAVLNKRTILPVKVNNSSWMEENTTNPTIPEKKNGLKAGYYMNVPKDHKRNEWMQSIWAESFPSIQLNRVETVELSDPRVQEKKFSVSSDVQVYSNFFSHRKMWAEFVNSSNDEEDWAIFMEDDVALHPSIRGQPERIQLAIDYLMQLGEEDGFVYLGICHDAFDTEWISQNCGSGASHQHDTSGVRFVRACGGCAHGYMLAKWRARTLFDDMASKCDLNCINCHFMDTLFGCWNTVQNQGLWLAGSNLTSHINGGHYGILYQERSLLGQSVLYR